jgi:hypothetical protein
MSVTSRLAATLSLAALVVVGAFAVAGPASAKPSPHIPVAAQAASPIRGASAAATVHRGSPSLASPAASQDGACDVGDLCLYYYTSPTWGSGYDTSHNDPNLFNNHFIFTGSGQGAVVGSNAEAYWNRDPRTYVYVCTGLNSSGSCGWLAPNTYGNLNSTYYNRSQSVFWADSAN